MTVECDRCDAVRPELFFLVITTSDLSIQPCPRRSLRCPTCSPSRRPPCSTRPSTSPSAPSPQRPAHPRDPRFARPAHPTPPHPHPPAMLLNLPSLHIARVPLSRTPHRVEARHSEPRPFAQRAAPFTKMMIQPHRQPLNQKTMNPSLRIDRFPPQSIFTRTSPALYYISWPPPSPRSRP